MTTTGCRLIKNASARAGRLPRPDTVFWSQHALVPIQPQAKEFHIIRVRTEKLKSDPGLSEEKRIQIQALSTNQPPGRLDRGCGNGHCIRRDW
jgi:hypothetical protein